uniref:Uncharacterized protein n=1 Tax=Trichogramma kaykai TaxID=54128 RepID=A0ABD2XET1_9HYME
MSFSFVLCYYCGTYEILEEAALILLIHIVMPPQLAVHCEMTGRQDTVAVISSHSFAVHFGERKNERCIGIHSVWNLISKSFQGGDPTTTTESLPRSICNNDHSRAPDKSVRRSPMSRSDPLQSLDIIFRPLAAAATFRHCNLNYSLRMVDTLSFLEYVNYLKNVYKLGKTYFAAWSTRPRWNLVSETVTTAEHQ